MELSFLRMIELLKKTQKIVITGHVNPDGDSLGSMLALYHYLVQQGKTVELLLDDDVPAMYDFLPGIDKINKPETTVAADLLVVVDASDAERFGAIQKFVKAPILNIDHHISNTKYADYYYIDAQSAATAQILMELLEKAGACITRDMGICLYTGIATECGFFRYANTTADTMYKAARLIELGIKPHRISEQLEIKSVTNIMTLTKVLGTLEFFYQGKIAVITVDASTEDIDSEGFINYPRNIAGVDIAVMFKITAQHLIRVSLRSREADVSKLSLLFGGGGHQRAAGCSIADTIEKAKEQVIQAAIEQLKESSHNVEGRH